MPDIFKYIKKLVFLPFMSKCCQICKNPAASSLSSVLSMVLWASLQAETGARKEKEGNNRV